MHTILNTTRSFPGRPDQRGMSLVEMMVGVAIGLFIVAAAATLVSGQLSDNRRLLIETQVQQDLRATMDTITRQLRRAGAVGDIAVSGMAPRDGTQLGGQRLTFCSGNNDCALVSAADPSEVDFYFVLSASEQGPFGFKLDNGVIKTNSGGGGWQELTDANSLYVDNLTIRIIKSTDQDPSNFTVDRMKLPCPKPCVNGTTDCWPKLEVRTIQVTMTAHPISDATASRTIKGTVRLANDRVLFKDATNPVCPV